ncbi:hypothetical protein SynRCC2555_01572 [Synechococcus sp. WH 8101]|nr:hypothetical protein SynRCC2555_01572 [Synechococcus sp. WH 8101]
MKDSAEAEKIEPEADGTIDERCHRYEINDEQFRTETSVSGTLSNAPSRPKHQRASHTSVHGVFLGHESVKNQ